MGAQLRVYRRRIRSVQSTKKITKAMELIAASRIAKLQQQRNAALPYAQVLTKALAALGANASVRHPMLTGVANARRVGVLVVTSDRGLAGGYNVNVLKRANQLMEEIRRDGKEPVLYVIGRKGSAFYRFRRFPLAGSWTGFSERPQFLDARAATDAVVAAVAATSDGEANGEAGVDELYLVYTVYKSAVTQTPTVAKLAPVEFDVAEAEAGTGPAEASADAQPGPLYEFEPEPEQLIAALLPRYISARIFSGLLESAASESAARRRAMKSASDNADDLIKTFTRLANQARQAEITQEISEIVGGADALASAQKDRA
jgi:F-type H+-transporting ATPase subunit gamma